MQRNSAIAFAVALFTAAPASASPRLPWYGDYLETNYLQTLALTKSPAAAARQSKRAHIAEMLSVQPQRDGRRLSLTYGWQSVQAVLLLQKDGLARRELAWGAGPAMALRLPDATTVCLAAPHNDEHCYHRVGNALGFITRAALAGRYVDRQGGEYRFGPDGVAHFPGDDFRYGLLLDQAGQSGDFFQIGGNGNTMAFRHEGALITLYAVGPSQGTSLGKPDYAHPLAVLRPVTQHLIAAN